MTIETADARTVRTLEAHLRNLRNPWNLI